ncbi:MAG: hemolysin family protein [Planctomycetota bacterium]
MIWFVLIVLLALSGLFSASETALFGLDREQRTRVGRKASVLLAQPGQLLVSILLGNLLINLLYFAVAGGLFPGDEGVGDLTVGLGVLVGLVTFGEILPKTLGLRYRVGMVRVASVPLTLWRWILLPISRPMEALLEASHRVVSTWIDDERALTPEMLARVMDRSARDETLIGAEAELLAEIVELGDIRVREIMTPRVDALFLDVSGANRDEVLAAAIERRQSWLPVVDGSPDNLLGAVAVRALFRDHSPVEQLVMPVKVVPEQANALDLLSALQEDRTSEAVVIDEWGGTAGYVTAENVFEELVGDLRTENEARAPVVVPLGEGRYRVRGSLSIRDWNEAFGMAVVPHEFETVGGFVTTLLGRIPRAGDTARVDRLVLEVHEVRGRRVELVDIFVEPGTGARSAS